MALRAVIFVHRKGGFGVGHVGWAFEHQGGLFNAGAVENLKGLPHSSPESMDFWTTDAIDPVAAMQAHDYDAYKIIEVANAHPEDAWRVVGWVSQTPYVFIGRNCMDDTYDVLRAFGVETLPLPAQHLLPNNWFDTIVGEMGTIDTPIAPSRWGRIRAIFPFWRERKRVIENGSSDFGPPAWRVEGTSAWQSFCERLTMIAAAHPRPPEAPIPSGSEGQSS